MKLAFAVLFLALTCATLCAQTAPPAPPGAENISGTYSFRREGEFVQINIEDGGKVTGFVSRYGDSESDRGVFLNQFFKTATLDGNNLSFTTETVHQVWFQLQAVVDHPQGKRPGEEGYRVLRGKLTEYTEDPDKKAASQVYDVALKSFPQDLGNPSKP